jgi:S1-C subfamily serine protease
MKKAFPVLLAVFGFAIGGCVGPLVPVVEVDQELGARLQKEIRVVDIAELQKEEYQCIGQIEATSCMNKLWDSPASREDALNQLRYKAAALGGNGITNLTWERREGANLTKNCWNSVTCYGVAIVLGPASEKSQKQVPEIAKSSGTGFAISENGLIATACHVIQGAKTIRVYVSKDLCISAMIVHSDPINDLALLKIENSTPNFLQIAQMRSVRMGDKVFTIGFPMISVLGQEAKYSEGVVSALSGLKDASSFLQITVPIQPGNSGGPLVNEKGEVVGIITSPAAILPFINESGTLPQNINWAVKADYLRPLTELPEMEPADLNREQLIDHVNKSTFFIEAE